MLCFVLEIHSEYTLSPFATSLHIIHMIKHKAFHRLVMFTVVIIRQHVEMWKLYSTHLEYLQFFDIDFLCVVWVGLKLTIFSSEPCVFWGCRCNYHDWQCMRLLIINCVVMLIEDIWCIHILIFKLSSRFPQLKFWVSFAWGDYNISYLFLSRFFSAFSKW